MKKIYIIVFIIIIIGSVFIKVGFNFENKEKSSVYSYTIEKNNDYNVLLKPNIFYEKEKLLSKGYYVSNSIDAYDINLKYKLKGSKKANIKYNYNIVASLIGTIKDDENEGKKVWNRDFVLLENNKKEENIDEMSINEKVNIDYEYYNNLVHSYENEYQVAIDAILKVRLNVSYIINFAKIGEKEDFIELDIPINDTVSEVKENYEKGISNNISVPNDNATFYKMFFLISGGLFIILGLTIIIINFVKLNQGVKKKYKNNLNRILNYYKDLIVNVIDEPNLKNLKVMEVFSFNDLINIAEQTKTNIIHYEFIKNEKNCFYVIVNEYVYIYTIILDNN